MEAGKTERTPVDPRILHAAERTLLAWLRTGIALITFGFVIARLGVWLRAQHAPVHPMPGSGLMGSLFGALGTAAEVLAIVRYVSFRRRVAAGRPLYVPSGTVLAFALGVALLGAILGALVLFHLAGSS
jgi:putative membrane protein